MKHQRYFWLASLLIAAALLSGLRGPAPRSAWAQDTTNLLTNGSLERPYYGQGAPTRTAPQGWNLWVGAGAPEAFPHTDRVQVRDGEVAWNVKQGYVAFTAAGWQRVSGLTKGDAVQLKAYGWVYTCNDTTNSCIINDPPYRRSDPSAGASLKVGIDPTGGTDPNSPAIKWSAGTAPYDQWAELSVVASAEGDSVTVFLFMTQAAGLALNNVYWDQVSLVRTTAAPAAQPTSAEVPFVVPQSVKPDGSIVHVVQEGDTLSSIAYAYNAEYGVTINSIVALNPGLKPNTRFLTIGQQIMILPPGSVDPKTGKLLPEGQRGTGTPGAPIPTVSGTPPTPRPTRPSSGASPVPSPTPIGGRASSAVQPTPIPASATPTTPAPRQTSVPLPALGESRGMVITEQVPDEGEAVALAATATTAPVQDNPTAAPSAIPAQPTLPPSATAQVVAQVPPASDQPVSAAENLTATNGRLCALVYQDADQNGAHEAGESGLTGAQLILGQPGSTDTASYDYMETDGPFCVDLLPGQYQLTARLPEGYGLTTADSASISLVSGRQVVVSFGGAQGYTPPAAPPAAAESESGSAPAVDSGAVAPSASADGSTSQGDKSLVDRLWDNSAYLALGLAGVVLVGGLGLLVLLRRTMLR